MFLALGIYCISGPYYSSINPHRNTTVWMESLTMFSRALHLLHHYEKSYSSFRIQKVVIEFLNAKRWAKNN